MSGGLVQLVATGDQDRWLTGKPEVSFYRSSFRRYTHFANSVERQLIQGTPQAGGISTVRFEKKGDLITYAYFTARDPKGAMVHAPDWSKVIDRVELMIGGQVIDTQDFTYMTAIEPVTGAQTFNQRLIQFGTDVAPTNKINCFFPLKFFFNKDWSSALPLIALQFHDVELRITWAAGLGDTAVSAHVGAGATKYSDLSYTLWTNFVYLDQGERDHFAKSEMDMIMTQVQRVPIASESMQELALAHPVKFIAFPCASYKIMYGSAGGSGGVDAIVAEGYKLKTQVNGVDIGEFRHLPHWVDIAQYYHTQYGYMPAVRTGSVDSAQVAIIPFCLDTSKLQPTGTLNFSRIDTYRMITSMALANGIKTLAGNAAYMYAVNYNVLRVKNGMGGLLYAN
jgi:hypothetical protein